MHTLRVVSFFLFCLFAVGCVSTAAQVTPATPDDAVADGSDAGQPEPVPAQPDTAAAPPDSPDDVTVNCAYPEGWTMRAVPERNGVLLSDAAGTATILFGILSPERGSAYEQLEHAWTSLSESVALGNPIEVSEPSTQEFDGVETSYFVVNGPGENGVPLTQMWVVFESNRPGLAIMLIGTWPQSRNEEMQAAFRMVAASIRIGEPSPGQPVPTPAPEPDAD
jgi:hypothetical protein